MTELRNTYLRRCFSIWILTQKLRRRGGRWEATVLEERTSTEHMKKGTTSSNKITLQTCQFMMQCNSSDNFN